MPWVLGFLQDFARTHLKSQCFCRQVPLKSACCYRNGQTGVFQWGSPEWPDKASVTLMKCPDHGIAESSSPGDAG